LPALKKASNVALTTVVTSTGVSAGHAGEKNGFAVIATDPAAALSDPDTDTVIVATRHDTHASLTASALRAGKHVFCEKRWPWTRKGSPTCSQRPTRRPECSPSASIDVAPRY